MNDDKSKLNNYDVIPIDKIAKCRYCTHPIAWLESKKTGKKYPVNAEPEDGRQDVLVTRNDFHKCLERDQATGRA